MCFKVDGSTTFSAKCGNRSLIFASPGSLMAVVERASSRRDYCKIAPHSGLAFLISHFELALNQLLTAVFAFAGHFAFAGKRVARPHLARETDLKAADISSPGVISQASRQAPCRPHTLGENGRNPSSLDEALIVVQRDEIAGGTRIADEIRPRDILDCHRRE
jgi:hypothetical protein